MLAHTSVLTAERLHHSPPPPPSPRTRQDGRDHLLGRLRPRGDSAHLPASHHFRLLAVVARLRRPRAGGAVLVRAGVPAGGGAAGRGRGEERGRREGWRRRRRAARRANPTALAASFFGGERRSAASARESALRLGAPARHPTHPGRVAHPPACLFRGRVGGGRGTTGACAGPPKSSRRGASRSFFSARVARSRGSPFVPPPWSLGPFLPPLDRAGPLSELTRERERDGGALEARRGGAPEREKKTRVLFVLPLGRARPSPSPPKPARLPAPEWA